MAKNTNRRSRKKYPAVDPNLNLKTRWEEITDVASYFESLSESDKKFMNNFMEEYVNANFNHKGKKIYKSKQDKRDIYNRNNARNRDVVTRSKACGKYVELDDPYNEKLLAGKSQEDYLITKIDIEKELSTKKKRKAKTKS